MEIIITPNITEFDYEAANQIAALIRKKPNCVLGLATGNTPKGMYHVLGEMCKKGEVDFSEVITANLDEYLDVEPSNPGSCQSYLREYFYKHVNLKPENIHHFVSNPANKEKECKRYQERILSIGGIDLLILGIGHNGHLGFNEPGTPFGSRIHISNLAEKTRSANIWSFGTKDKVPHQGITMGIKDIMHARKLLMLANGQAKAEIIYQAIYGEISTELPASILQLHQDVTIVLDKEAAHKIMLSDEIIRGIGLKIHNR